MKVTEIFEARRNPHLNPKSDFVAEFYYLYHKYKDNLFLSFTELNKIGVNPQSIFSTPLGVYAYPAKFVQKILEERGYNTKRLPFAGDRPYVQFLESRGNGLDFDHYNYHDLERDLKALFKFTYGVEMSNESFKEIQYLRYIGNVSRFDKLTPATFLWTVVYIYTLCGTDDDGGFRKDARKSIESILNGNETDYKGLPKENFLEKKQVINWNTILYRIMGYDYVVDNGYGIIYPAESYQAVFLTNKGYSHIGTFELGEEGADKTSKKYDKIDFNAILDNVLSYLKKDFPHITKETKIKTSASSEIHKTLEEVLRDNLKWYRSYVKISTEESVRNIKKFLRGLLIKQELFNRDYVKNIDVYHHYNVPTFEIYDKFDDQLLGDFFNGREYDSDYVDIIRKNEESITDKVHKILSYYYGVPVDRLK